VTAVFSLKQRVRSALPDSRDAPFGKTRSGTPFSPAKRPCARSELVCIIRFCGGSAARFHIRGVRDDSFMFLFDVGFLHDVRDRLRRIV
jgi:hypothetical protein